MIRERVFKKRVSKARLATAKENKVLFHIHPSVEMRFISMNWLLRTGQSDGKDPCLRKGVAE